MSRGFLVLTTLDRLDELRKMITSLKMYNDYPVVVAIAADAEEAHRIKTLCAVMTPFDYTVFLDTDMMINGNLDYLFEVAESGKIGIVRERKYPVLNSGVLAFSRYMMMPVCELWNSLYETRIKSFCPFPWGVYEQDILGQILEMNPDTYPHVEMPVEYNMILKDITPEEEKLQWNKIKIFHFLHCKLENRHKYKSYQDFMLL